MVFLAIQFFVRVVDILVLQQRQGPIVLVPRTWEVTQIPQVHLLGNWLAGLLLCNDRPSWS